MKAEPSNKFFAGGAEARNGASRLSHPSSAAHVRESKKTIPNRANVIAP